MYEPPIEPQPYYQEQMPPLMPPATIMNQADLVEKISPKELAKDIEHKLKGEVYDWEKEIWYVPEDKEGNRLTKPFLNDKGLWRIMSIVTSFINDNTIYSNLKEEEIGRLMVKLSRQLIGLLRIKYREFDIDKAYLTTVKAIVMNTTYLALKRAKGGNERILLGKSINVQENIMRSDYERQSKGLLNLPKFFK